MVTGVQVLGTLTTGAYSVPSGQVEIVQITNGDAPQIAVADYTVGQRTIYALSADGSLNELSTTSTANWNRAAMDLPGISGSVPRVVVNDLLAAAAVAGTGGSSGATSYLAPAASQEKAVSLLAVTPESQTVFVAAAADYSGLAVLRYSETTGSFTTQQIIADSDARHLSNVSDLASVQVGGTTYVYAGSASEDGLTGFRMAADGMLSQVADLGTADSLPVHTVTALEAVQVGGKPFLVLGASGSSSLTVMQVQSGGALAVTDHVVDDLTTRFQGVTHVETVTDGDRGFVVATGMDAGITVFSLTAEGRLVHLATLADTDSAALHGVSGLSASVVGGELVILTTSGSEPGLTRLGIDLSAGGVVASAVAGQLSGGTGDDVLSLTGSTGGAIRAGAGDDILTDGFGSDTLDGGAGRDIFVLRADGCTDTIRNLVPGEDLIDLSAWPMLYSATALGYQQTATGAVLTWRDETLILSSASGKPLTLAQIQSLIPSIASHVSVTLADQQTSTSEPAPETGTIPTEVPVDQRISGTAGGDILTGGTGADTLLGGGGADQLDGQAGMDVLNGGSGNDTLLGGLDRDKLFGGDGDDLLRGGEGHDLLYGEAGQDALYGDLGNDFLNGGAGNDSLWGGEGNDTLTGGTGDDLLSGGIGDDRLFGEAGNDALSGDAGNDLIYGGFGHDSLSGNDGDDLLFGDAGNDRLSGGMGNDKLYGGADADTLSGDDGNDLLSGGDGNDLLWGGSGADRLLGGAGNDSLYGGAGSDFLSGDDGADALWGGTEGDTLLGGAGNDTLMGEAGNDRLVGGDGNDVLVGGYGNDVLIGGAGNDRLIGGPGCDVLTGGEGADTFVFDFSTGAGRDRIADFDAGVDHLAISGLAGATAADKFSTLTLADSDAGLVVSSDQGSVLLSGCHGLTSPDFVFG